MKEYWVNVYTDKPEYVYAAHDRLINANGFKCDDLAYRLHIKMKDKPGLVGSYPYSYDDRRMYHWGMKL